MADRLYLIDGTALAYRSYFAFAAGPRGGLSTKSGHPTSATYGFLATLNSLIQREKPDRIAIAFDGSRDDLARTEVYPEYKSTREKAPDEMVVQFDDIRRVVEGHGITMLTGKRHEADDIIGTLAVRARDAGMQVFIVTGDKDFMQLIDDKVKLWNLRASTTAPEIIGTAQVEAKYGVRPDQMIDLLALMGDSSDNVPGVPRVGQKTASEILQQFGTLENALDNAEDYRKPSIRKALVEHREMAELSKDLVTIATDIDVGVEVADIGGPQPDVHVLFDLYTELEFDTLAKALDLGPVEEVETRYDTVEDSDALDGLIASLQGKPLALSVITSTRVVRDAGILGVAFSSGKGHGVYVPCTGEPVVVPGGGKAVLEKLRPILEDPATEKTSAEGKFAMAVLHQNGIELRGLVFDTALASYCAHADHGSHDLATLAERHLKHHKIEPKSFLGTGKKQKQFDQVERSLTADYACEDADLTWRIREVLEPELDDNDVRQIYADLEMPLLPVLMRMEWEGIAVDQELLARLDAEMGKRIAGIEERIFERAGEPFNLNSPAQIGVVLFDNLEVHKAAGVRPKKTRTGQWKTDAAMLEKLAKHHEVPELILEHRRLTKLVGTYIETLPRMAHASTGRIHTTFNQAVAATGRLSSDDPNLQNIPIRTPEGREVRKAFIARDKKWVLLSADYSQIELRILAHMSGDPALVESFRKGEDIHARTAALVHGMMPELVSLELRNQAKIINYGLMYGMGASRLANETGMRPPEAKKFIESYFRALPKVKAYLDGTLDDARTRGEVRTLFGRRRALPEIESANPMQRIAAENMAVNTPIQGAAADIIKRAMLAVDAELTRRELRARMVLQVHDELVLDVPEDELQEAQILLRDAMVGAAELDVPLEVSMGSGWNWVDAH